MADMMGFYVSYLGNYISDMKFQPLDFGACNIRIQKLQGDSGVNLIVFAADPFTTGTFINQQIARYGFIYPAERDYVYDKIQAIIFVMKGLNAHGFQLVNIQLPNVTYKVEGNQVMFTIAPFVEVKDRKRITFKYKDDSVNFKNEDTEKILKYADNVPNLKFCIKFNDVNKYDFYVWQFNSEAERDYVFNKLMEIKKTIHKINAESDIVDNLELLKSLDLVDCKIENGTCIYTIKPFEDKQSFEPKKSRTLEDVIKVKELKWVYIEQFNCYQAQHLSNFYHLYHPVVLEIQVKKLMGSIFLYVSYVSSGIDYKCECLNFDTLEEAKRYVQSKHDELIMNLLNQAVEVKED